MSQRWEALALWWMRCTNWTGPGGGLIVRAQRRTKSLNQAVIKYFDSRRSKKVLITSPFFALTKAQFPSQSQAFARLSSATTSFSYFRSSLRFGRLYLPVRPFQIQRTLRDMLLSRVQEAPRHSWADGYGLKGRTSGEKVFSLYRATIRVLVTS
jgi:hypothetical protein